MSKNVSKSSKKGSKLVLNRKKKVKDFIQYGSRIIRGSQLNIYTDCATTFIKEDPGLTDIYVPPFQKLGVKLLMDGHPKAFIEFFELTHQPQPPNPSVDYVHPEDAAKAKQLVDVNVLTPLKVAMENAEISAREGNQKQICLANHAIGCIFEDVKDPKQALFYFWRAFCASEKTKVPKDIALARFALGKVYWKLQDNKHAIQNFEEFIKLAKTNKNIAGTVEAAESLLKIHIKSAKQNKEDGDFQSSLESYEKALDSSIQAQNWVAVGEMRYQLGVLNCKLKHSDKALEYLTEFHQYCVKAKDLVGQGKANAAMSEVFESLDHASNAVANMEKYLNAVDNFGLLTKAKATCKIGMLYYRMGNLVAADQYYTSYYEMARQSKDVKTLALARTNLGIVRAGLNKSPGHLKEEDQPAYNNTLNLPSSE